jgi:hypothetical protein
MNPSTIDNSIILVPTYRAIEPETDEALKKLEAIGWRVERRYGMASIDGARAMMATWAFMRGYEWIYWIDSDILFEVADFVKLADWQEPFCCAPYAIKGSGGMVAARAAIHLDHTTTGLVELEAAGFGFIKTHCSVYVRMAQLLPTCQQAAGNAEKLIPFFQPRWWKEEDGRSVYYGEDYSFCLHAKQLGFKLYGDFDIQIGHIGRWAFRIRDPL